MNYPNIHPAIFVSRPNRFIAYCELEGRQVICHVKNTGRCRELLVPGCTVYLCRSDKPERRTKYDLVAVDKGGRLINMDAQAPNAVAGEWLRAGGLFSEEDPAGAILARPEVTFGDSRLDFYLELGERKAFLEVKGVTLEQDGVVLFPDAPTQRGVKHLQELIRAVEQGYEAYVLFVVQMSDVAYFTPNRATHPAFAEALAEAAAAGVHILCYDCHTAPQHLSIDKPVPVRL